MPIIAARCRARQEHIVDASSRTRYDAAAAQRDTPATGQNECRCR